MENESLHVTLITNMKGFTGYSVFTGSSYNRVVVRIIKGVITPIDLSFIGVATNHLGQNHHGMSAIGSVQVATHGFPLSVKETRVVSDFERLWPRFPRSFAFAL